MRIASGSDVPANTGSNCSIRVAAAMPARNPRNIDSPPSTGSGRVWTRCSSGATTILVLNESHRAAGVSSRVVPAATTSTTR